VFDKNSNADMTLKYKKKCHFITFQIQFHGHFILDCGMCMDPFKGQDHQDFPPPRTKKDFQSLMVL